MCEQAKIAPETLDVQALSKRLEALAGEEREVQAEFLRHLDAFDLRRGYAELGHSSLWDYCLRALHLREGAAGRRIGAMRVLRRFPRLAAALREGRLCLSTLCLLSPVLTEDNVDELARRSAFRTRAEVEDIVASVRPHRSPREGLRAIRGGESSHERGSDAALRAGAAASPSLQVEREKFVEREQSVERERPLAERAAPPSLDAAARPAGEPPAPALPPFARRSTSDLRPVDGRSWSLRVTLDADAKGDLETLAALLSHKIPRRDLSAAVKEALRCAVEKHGKRRGAVSPSRARRPLPRGPAPDPAAAPMATDLTAAVQNPNPTATTTETATTTGTGTGTTTATGTGTTTTTATPTPPPNASCAASGPARSSRYISAAVRRAVWTRDGGCCTYVAPDGTRCGSRDRLELDHVQPFALGGEATVDDLRLRCRTHNLWYAEQWFGRSHMAKFRGRAARRGAARVATGRDVATATSSARDAGPLPPEHGPAP